jgi:hypothetical protein
VTVSKDIEKAKQTAAQLADGLGYIGALIETLEAERPDRDFETMKMAFEDYQREVVFVNVRLGNIDNEAPKGGDA